MNRESRKLLFSILAVLYLTTEVIAGFPFKKKSPVPTPEA